MKTAAARKPLPPPTVELRPEGAGVSARVVYPADPRSLEEIARYRAMVQATAQGWRTSFHVDPDDGSFIVDVFPEASVSERFVANLQAGLRRFPGLRILVRHGA
jgi:hypothetical protein